MNSNRGQYNESPMYNMKNKRQEKKRPAPQPANEDQGWARMPPEGEAQGMKRHVFLSVVLSFVLPILFLVSLIIPSNELRWAFLIVTVLSVFTMWLLGAFVRSARNTLTVIYAALAVVIGLALFMNQQSPEALRAIATRNPPSAVQQDEQALLNAMPTETPAPTTDPESLKPEAQRRLESIPPKRRPTCCSRPSAETFPWSGTWKTTMAATPMPTA